MSELTVKEVTTMIAFFIQQLNLAAKKQLGTGYAVIEKAFIGLLEPILVMIDDVAEHFNELSTPTDRDFIVALCDKIARCVIKQEYSALHGIFSTDDAVAEAALKRLMGDAHNEEIISLITLMRATDFSEELKSSMDVLSEKVTLLEDLDLFGEGVSLLGDEPTARVNPRQRRRQVLEHQRERSSNAAVEDRDSDEESVNIATAEDEGPTERVNPRVRRRQVLARQRERSSVEESAAA